MNYDGYMPICDCRYRNTDNNLVLHSQTAFFPNIFDYSRFIRVYNIPKSRCSHCHKILLSSFYLNNSKIVSKMYDTMPFEPPLDWELLMYDLNKRSIDTNGL